METVLKNPALLVPSIRCVLHAGDAGCWFARSQMGCWFVGHQHGMLVASLQHGKQVCWWTSIRYVLHAVCMLLSFGFWYDLLARPKNKLCICYISHFF